MATRTLKTTLVVLACVVVISVGGYVVRESLVRMGINAFLAGDTAVTKLQGLQLGSSHAAISELELSLGASGQRLLVADINADFTTQGLFSAPIINNLTIASARLTEGAVPTESDANVDEADGSANSELLLSELLQQLREFPVQNIDLDDLQVPQFRQTLAIHAAQQAGALELRVTSGTLQLLVTFSQTSPDASAQLVLSLDANATTVASAQLSLQPQASGYALTGSGNIKFSDANTPFAEYLTTPLPLSSVALDWNLTALVPDEVLNDPASSINLEVAPGSTMVLRAEAVSGLGELTIDIPEQAELGLVPGAQVSVGNGRIPLRLMGSWQQQALQATVTLTPSMCLLSASACNVGFEGSASLAGYTLASTDADADTTITALEFVGTGNANISSDAINVTINPDSRLGSGLVTSPAFSITSINVVSVSALELHQSLIDEQLSFSAGEVSLALAGVTIGEYQASADFSLHDLSLISADKLSGKMQLQTTGLSVTGPQWIPVIGFDAGLSIDGETLAFSTPLLLPNAPADAQLQASGTYDLAAGASAVNLKLPPLTLTGPGNSLSSYLSGWPFMADVMTGTLALELNLQTSPAAVDANAATTDDASATVITANTKIALTDVAGFYEENFFKGLNTTLDAAYDSAAASLPVTTPPLSLTIDELNVGMPITEISLNYQFDAASQIMNVSSIFGKLLDGTVSGTDITYDFSKTRNDMTFMFAGLRLERMLELAEYEGVEASGAVSGELPVSIADGKVEVDAGTLYAEMPGGSIRYLNAPPAGQGNPAMDLVNQALSNYQFQSLESTIDYSPDGELLLGMQLRGHNPDMNGGQAINLNLNISDNIPTLLKSLQAGREIEDFLQEQYK